MALLGISSDYHKRRPTWLIELVNCEGSPTINKQARHSQTNGMRNRIDDYYGADAAELGS